MSTRPGLSRLAPPGGWAGPGARRLACGLVLACPLWVVSASMVHGPAPNASLSHELGAQVKPTDEPTGAAAQLPLAEAPATGAVFSDILPAEIDLLLELQLEDHDLGPNPVDPAASAPQQAAVDVRSLSPGLPANPVFPGHGLSFEPPAVNPKALLDHEGLGYGDRDDTSAEGAGWSRQLASKLGFAQADEDLRDQLRDFRLWVAGNRVGLLVAVGGAAVLLAALVGVLRAVKRPRRVVPAGAAASTGRARRRGSRSSAPHRR